MTPEGRCECAAGTEPAGGQKGCVACKPGFFEKERYCFRCPFGQHSGGGASPCRECPKGMSAASTNGRRCVKVAECEKGYFVPGEHVRDFKFENSCVKRKTGCPKGLQAKVINGYEVSCVDKKGKIVCGKGFKAVYDWNEWYCDILDAWL